VRRLGIVVSAASATSVTVTLERRPPPITTVTETDRPSLSAGTALGRLIPSREVRTFDFRRDASNLTRGVSEVDAPSDGRDGFAQAAGGLAPAWSRLFVDGVPELMLRHPGVPGEPVTAPVFQRDGIDQAQLLSVGMDAEWRGVPASILALQSRGGSRRVQFSPFATFSGAKLGGQSLQNPADSAATSLQFGAVLSGSIVPDTAHFMLRADYQSLETASAFPWETDTTAYRGQQVSLRETIPLIGADSFGTQLQRYVAPVVRTWRGGSAMGRLDWQLSGDHGLMVRAGFASWKETSPQLGRHAASGSGSALEARDMSGAVALTSTGAEFANELRVGFSAARREWTGSAIPTTELAAEGVALGASSALPGLFNQRAISISDAFQYAFGMHQLKVGGNVEPVNYEQDYRFGSAGIFTFGSLDRFGAGEGAFYQSLSSESAAKFTSANLGFFLQDSWSVSPELQVLLGLRYDTQTLPKGKIALRPEWLAATGIANDFVPKDRKGISPRFGFVWDVNNRGEWVVRGGGGIHAGSLQPSQFAEAMLFDGAVKVRRGLGVFSGWPAAPSSSLAPYEAVPLTLFADTYRAPRTFKADLGVTRVIGGGMTLNVTGGYHHTDYLLRRTDLNRATGGVETTQEGRPLFGTLVKQGGLLSADPGSNRRFDGLDLVSALSPTGFSDHYEITAGLEGRLSRGLTLNASYTFSRTRDNLNGALEPDPADQLSPFPDGLNGADWTEGRSDLDVPHRVVATLEYKSAGSTPISVAARYRRRSGLPFTPGFRSGVDANGDAGGNNDPAYLDSGLSGLTSALAAAGCGGATVNAFAERNSCREEAVHALDLRLSLGLPVRAGGARVAITLDAFNVVSTAAGLVDRALVLVDPAGSITGVGSGTVTLPLIANPRFGTLLSRRGEPRLVRIGLGIEY
jgi:hypothetical protein